MHRFHWPPRVDGTIGEFDVAGPELLLRNTRQMQRDHPCVSLRAAEFKDSKILKIKSPRLYRTHVMDAELKGAGAPSIMTVTVLWLHYWVPI